MKDKTLIKFLITALIAFIVLTAYQVLLINKLSNHVEILENDRDKVIEKYNKERNK